MTNELKFFQLIKICHFWNIFCLLCCDGSSHKKNSQDFQLCYFLLQLLLFLYIQYWKSQRLFWIIQMQHDKWVEFFSSFFLLCILTSWTRAFEQPSFLPPSNPHTQLQCCKKFKFRKNCAKFGKVIAALFSWFLSTTHNYEKPLECS